MGEYLLENDIVCDDFRNVKNKLDEMLDSINDYYQVIYESIPEIERNINLTEEEISILIEYLVNFKSHSKNEDDKKELISQALMDIKKDFQNVSNMMIDQNNINQMLKSFMNENKEEISYQTLLGTVKETKIVLEDVNLMAINSIIFSSEKEIEGGGFRVISQNIHNVSTFMKKQFSNISSSVNDLSQWHSNFEKNINQFVSLQENTVNNYIYKLDEVFNSITDLIKMINYILKDLIQNVKKIIKPFEDMMVLIQGEDIVKQNIENIINSILIIQEKYINFKNTEPGNVGQNKKIDYFIFVYKGLELIDNLLQSTFQELFNSTDEIRSIVNKILNELKEIKTDATNISFLLYNEKINKSKDEENPGGSIDITFSEVINFIDNFFKELKKMKDITKNNNRTKENFEKYTDKIDKYINKIDKKMNRLNKLELLGRIELARIGKKNSGFSKEMQTTVKKVIEVTNNNNNTFSQLKPKLQKKLSQFNKIIQERNKKINEIISGVDNSLEKINITNNIVNEAVLALNEEINYLEKNFITIQKKLNLIDNIKNKRQTIERLLENINEKINYKKQNTYKKYDIENRKLKNENLQEIVNQFTTYIERETTETFLTGEITKNKNETAGELTLF